LTPAEPKDEKEYKAEYDKWAKANEDFKMAVAAAK